MKLAVLIILQMGMLQFIPPLFYKTPETLDIVFFSIMYMMLTTVGITLPYLVPKLPRALKVTSMLFAGWFFSSTAFGVMGIFSPSLLENISTPSGTFTRYTLVFMATIVFLILNESWNKNTTKS